MSRKVEITSLSNQNFISLGTKPIGCLYIANTHSSAITVVIAYADTTLVGGTSLTGTYAHLVKDVSIPAGQTLVLEEEILSFTKLNTIETTTLASSTALTGKCFLLRLSSAGSADLIIKHGLPGVSGSGAIVNSGIGSY